LTPQRLEITANCVPVRATCLNPAEIGMLVLRH
jgi:hypothetical protein